jgi:hypothetical protein
MILHSRRIVVVYDPPKPGPNEKLRVEVKRLAGRCIMVSLLQKRGRIIISVR